MPRRRTLSNEARDRQVQLKQALEELALANRETVRLNEMLSLARKAVEEARKAKEEFVANVSHELRTPLNMIIGFSEMILEAPRVYGASPAQRPAGRYRGYPAQQPAPGRPGQRCARPEPGRAGRMALSRE